MGEGKKEDGYWEWKTGHMAQVQTGQGETLLIRETMSSAMPLDFFFPLEHSTKFRKGLTLKYH